MIKIQNITEGVRAGNVRLFCGTQSVVQRGDAGSQRESQELQAFPASLVFLSGEFKKRVS